MIDAQLPLSLVSAGAVEVGGAAALIEHEDGGRVYVHGGLTSVAGLG